MVRFETLPPAPPLPLQQSPAYVAALADYGTPVSEARLEVGRAAVMTRQLALGITVRLVSRGPIWDHGITEAEKVTALKTLAQGGPILVTPDSEEDAGPLRRAGYRRILTPVHVAELALLPSAAAQRALLAGSWRNALKKAEAQGLNLARAPLKPRRDSWLLQEESRQRKAKGYRAIPVALTPGMAVAAPGDTRVFVARRGASDPPLAAIVVIRHGDTATYHIGWTSREGRAANATHLLLWQAILWLIRHGVTRFDLGSVDSETAPGLMRFKLGTGAEVRSLGGTWLRILPPGLLPWS